MSTRLVEAGGVRWNVLVEGKGPVVLMLHGTGASIDSLRGLVGDLSDRYTLVAPDLPGHAFSTPRAGFEPTLPAIGRALRALLDALGLEPVAGIGHSAGAAILVHMVAKGLVHLRVLVGIAPALVPFRGLAGVVFPVAARLLARSRVAPHLIAFRARHTRSIDRMVEGTGTTLDDEALDRYRALCGRPEHVAGVIAMMSKWDLVPLWDALPTLPTRLLVLAGERDRAVPAWQARAAAERAADGRFVRIPDAGHVLHEEAPAEVAHQIARELETISNTTSGRRDSASASQLEAFR